MFMAFDCGIILLNIFLILLYC